MSSHIRITPEQLGALFWSAELGGDAKSARRFSYAEKGQSSYAFGLPQFDVGHNEAARKFLKENGFSDTDIDHLSQHGGLSRTRLDRLDAQLQAIPQARIDRLTRQHLGRLIGDVDQLIDRVHEQNPAAADAIAKDPALQLSIADYANQFGPAGPQLVGFLAGRPETLQGGIVQASDPDAPVRDDLLRFVRNTKYGQDPHHARAIESRNARFDEAVGKLGLAPSLQAHAPVAGVAGMREPGARGDAVRERAAVVPREDARHPDHALFEQATTAVRALDAQHGRATDQRSLNLAAALAAAAKREGLTRIDQVSFNDDASRAFAVQHPTHPRDQPRAASVDTMTALQTPAAQSAALAASIQAAQTAPSVPAQIQAPTPTRAMTL